MNKKILCKGCTSIMTKLAKTYNEGFIIKKGRSIIPVHCELCYHFFEKTGQEVTCFSLFETKDTSSYVPWEDKFICDPVIVDREKRNK